MAMLAAENGRGRILEMLLQNGADVTISSHDGKTAQMVALRKGYLGIAQLIVDHILRGSEYVETNRMCVLHAVWQSHRIDECEMYAH